MKKNLMFALAITALLSACKKDNNNDLEGTFKGPVVQVHGGKAWTWIQLNKQGNPLRLAVTIDDAALNSVPVGGHDGHNHDHADMSNNWVLKFHPKAAATPFNHVGLGWNPTGHEPEIIYGIPHFDFHFYIPTPQEIDAIPDFAVDPTKFLKFPAPAYLPPTYINPGGGVAKMGAHWVDATSPELNGQPFTQTFIYGSYDSKVTFYEPMITLNFLKQNSNFQRSIPQPAKVEKTGWYPTIQRVVKHDGITEVILDAFVFRAQS